ncbi:hypothetical protein A680_01673 [Salmonella enterica subsp. enterica serovar Enteritidis str. 2010K-0286]|nr:hypothetical protein A680_01673 [Salmonella enterica subsp. enterica serovar Enteritidis str. 2010K-0286]
MAELLFFLFYLRTSLSVFLLLPILLVALTNRSMQLPAFPLLNTFSKLKQQR